MGPLARICIAVVGHVCVRAWVRSLLLVRYERAVLGNCFVLNLSPFLLFLFSLPYHLIDHIPRATLLHLSIEKLQ